MIFVFASPQTVYFWMKNTLLPLDMLFLDGVGSVLAVLARARPEDLTVISSPAGTQYVIEIVGGSAVTLGLEPGTVMTAWSCVP